MTSQGLAFNIPTVFEAGTIEDAFHGTDKESSKAILAQGRFQAGTQGGMYGPGIYFFEGDYEAADWWTSDRNKVRDPVVIRAKVNLGRTLYVNFLGREIQKLCEGLSRRLNRPVEPRGAYSVLVAQLRREDLVDSLKAVRSYKIEKRKYDRTTTYCAEIVVVLLKEERAIPLGVLGPEELNTKVSIGL